MKTYGGLINIGWFLGFPGLVTGLGAALQGLCGYCYAYTRRHDATHGPVQLGFQLREGLFL